MDTIAKPPFVRYFTRRDIPELVRMESFTDDPWIKDDFLELYSNQTSNDLVASEEVNQEARYGHIAFEYRRTALRIIRVCVQPYLRRRGIARELVRCVLNRMRNLNRYTHVIADVPEECLSGQLLMSKCGLRYEHTILRPTGRMYRFLAWK
jgi:ribosomal protein S18 acetylase RimI-like enzyme